MSKDNSFLKFAGQGIGKLREPLIDPKPMKFEKVICNLSAADLTPFPVKERISTKEELNSEMEMLKRRISPFLENRAPAITQINRKKYITEFVVDGKQTVRIPEFGGPIGNGKKTYEAEFELQAVKPEKVYYIRFLGADYRAVVSVNGSFAGSHEGFFAAFEFDITEYIHPGKNTLKVELYNDYIYQGNKYEADEAMVEGDKLYAATGLGWDDPVEGWHHCPAGMGIYNHVYLEERNRLHIQDLFVRPLPQEHAAEVWLEVMNTGYETVPLQFSLSLYGQNFEETVFENREVSPELVIDGGAALPLPAQHGVHVYKIRIPIENPKIWDLDTPWLYQLQARLIAGGAEQDIRAGQFGMREFYQDLERVPKGAFYLNGRKVKLRGLNTMGFEQLAVMRGEHTRLLEDLIMAKAANANFLRLAQRPVQQEVYELCDKIGLMTQTDLPLFGCMRRTAFCEGVKQAEEMERHVRAHPCNVLNSYINEPFAYGKWEPHRHMLRHELEAFFTACDLAMHLQNPDRVIKHVDGDYDPPSDTLPDNHCYPMWYNGHGIDIGRLHKGCWFSVKPNWYFGCGEYGGEALDSVEVMKKHYPKQWLTEPFSPSNIVRAQTPELYRFFYDTPDSMEEWVSESQRFQALGTSMMTEAFRRNPNMNTYALHHFIDAWPSAWMKAIVDVDRIPKQAFFAFKNACEPVLLSLRSDRFTYYADETVSIETYICNDTQLCGSGFTVRYEVYDGEKLILTQSIPAAMEACEVSYIANCEFRLDKAADRCKLKVRGILMDAQGIVLSYSDMIIELFEDAAVEENEDVVLIEMLPEGEYEIAGETVTVKRCFMRPKHFVSRKTGHPAVAGFEADDFRHWYDAAQDRITPILYNPFIADGFAPILLTATQTPGSPFASGYVPALACGVKEYEGKKYIICQVDLREENPVARRFRKALMAL